MICAVFSEMDPVFFWIGSKMNQINGYSMGGTVPFDGVKLSISELKMTGWAQINARTPSDYVPLDILKAHM